ncbi:MAG: hypothetical protein KatS3mg078_1931 [Deltaproteobacteria bacterium]|jgi:hypothetical protein|nr:MAG: hypothetical protein KatS3mg078_1931 [Deltaproteobacteria bacterium]
MERTLFAKGSRGEVIKRIQIKLKECGFDPGGIDGVFGRYTQRAVFSFQRIMGLSPTGEVDVSTWDKLIGEKIPSLQERLLQLISEFEGHGFTLVRGNWDGAGLTWGILGFTLKYGKIGKIILEAYKRNPETLRYAFGRNTEFLIDIVKAPLEVQLAWADSISVGRNKLRLSQPWHSAFERFGELEEIQRLQKEVVEKDYFLPALETAREYGLKSELGIALSFDIQVQNGGIKKNTRKEIMKSTTEVPLGSEQELRIIIAHAVADSAKPEFQDDVRLRKLTLATGCGKVHGKLYVLRNWGLDESLYLSFL